MADIQNALQKSLRGLFSPHCTESDGFHSAARSLFLGGLTRSITYLPHRTTTKVILDRNTSILIQTDPAEKEVKDCDIEGVSVIMKSHAPLKRHLGSHFVSEHDGRRRARLSKPEMGSDRVASELEFICCPHTCLGMFLSRERSSSCQLFPQLHITICHDGVSG